jgi:hypothetical protein
VACFVAANFSDHNARRDRIVIVEVSQGDGSTTRVDGYQSQLAIGALPPMLILER